MGRPNPNPDPNPDPNPNPNPNLNPNPNPNPNRTRYLAKGAHTLGWLPLPVELTLGACVPLIGASVYLGLHRLKASVMGGKAH